MPVDIGLLTPLNGGWRKIALAGLAEGRGLGSNVLHFCHPLDRRTLPLGRLMSASLIGRLGVKHFQAIHHCSVDVAHGLVLLFGIGTKALPSWDPRTRRNNLLVGLAVS